MPAKRLFEIREYQIKGLPECLIVRIQLNSVCLCLRILVESQNTLVLYEFPVLIRLFRNYFGIRFLFDPPGAVSVFNVLKIQHLFIQINILLHILRDRFPI